MTLPRLLLPALLLSAHLTFAFVKLTPETERAFDRYIELSEERMKHDLDPARFLHADMKPEVKAKLRGGEVRIEPGVALDKGKVIDVPGGLIQDWVGSTFFPNSTIEHVKTVLQDYGNYKHFYKPEVIESAQTGHQGDEYDVFLRLYKKQVLTVVLNTNYHVHYGLLDARRMYVTSHSTRIAELKNPKRPEQGEETVGDDNGFLWRLNSYWRFEEGDGGVYAECEAISLSRDVPAVLGWMVKGFLEKFPKESMQNTLRGTKAALASRN